MLPKFPLGYQENIGPRPFGFQDLARMRCLASGPSMVIIDLLGAIVELRLTTYSVSRVVAFTAWPTRLQGPAVMLHVRREPRTLGVTQSWSCRSPTGIQGTLITRR